MLACNCKEIPIYNIIDFGETVKSTSFDFARLQNRMNTLPYPHRHDFFHVIWVTEGTGTHTIDSVSYSVTPNTMFFMKPGQIHNFDLSDDATGYTLNFSQEFFQLNMRSEKGIDNIPFFRLDNPVQALHLTENIACSLQSVMDCIEEEYQSELHGYHNIICSYLHILFTLTTRVASQKGHCKDHVSPHTHLARRFRKLLEEGPITLTSSSRYAQILCVTERRLSEATKAAEGLTATEVIHHRLGLEAKRLLAHSELNIATVAVRLGFEDPAYFSRFFKKRFDLSPSEFRKRSAGLKNQA